MIESKRIASRDFARWLLALIFLLAGTAHLLVPAPFLTITPDWVPFPGAVILLTGLAEIAGAVGLMTRRWRPAAGIGLAIYAIAVYPANIQHALDSLRPDTSGLTWWYHGPRLLCQPVIVWWALWVGEAIDWPFRRN